MTKRVSRRAALVAGLFAASALLGGSASGAPVPKGDDNKSWVGKTVLPKKPDPLAVIKNPDPDHPRPINADGTVGEPVRPLRGASWEVKSEKDARVELVEDGVAVWLEKEALVPLSEAIEFFTKALKENDKDAYAHNFRGWAKYLLGKPDDAVKDFDEFLKLLPDGATWPRAVGLSNRGLVLAEMGKFDAALKDLDEAAQTSYPLARLNRGWTYDLKGDYKKALADYAALLEQAPGHTLGLNNIAWLKATCPDAAFRDGKEAVKLAQQVCERTGNRDGNFLDTLAAAHAEAGDFAAAVKTQEKALEDKGYVRKYGEDGQKRLQLYKDKKPYRTTPLK
jgi:tetratricopeptide (TPR) repeat protein